MEVHQQVILVSIYFWKLKIYFKNLYFYNKGTATAAVTFDNVATADTSINSKRVILAGTYPLNTTDLDNAVWIFLVFITLFKILNYLTNS